MIEKFGTRLGERLIDGQIVRVCLAPEIAAKSCDDSQREIEISAVFDAKAPIQPDKLNMMSVLLNSARESVSPTAPNAISDQQQKPVRVQIRGSGGTAAPGKAAGAR